MVKTFWLSVVAVIGFGASFAQDPHSLKVFFRYGSIPEIGYEYVEYEEIGGLHGGHVSLGIDSLEIGFTNDKTIHLFPGNNHKNGVFYWEYLKDFEDQVSDKKYITFVVPLSEVQYDTLRTILLAYIDESPYDYAFFGMRCTSAAYDVLSQIGLLEPKTRAANIISNFYPKMLRRKMFQLARQRGYTVVRAKGRKTRIWDND